jgi:hypothetical protein
VYMCVVYLGSNISRCFCVCVYLGSSGIAYVCFTWWEYRQAGVCLCVINCWVCALVVYHL